MAEGVEELTATEAAAAKLVADKAAQRNSIKVESVAPEKEETEGEVETEVETEVEGEVVEATEVEGETEVTPIDAKEVEKLKKTIARLQKRVDKTTAEKAATAKELADAKVALAAKPEGEKVLTDADVEARANQKQLEREFANDCNKLWKEGTKADKDFQTKVDAMAEDIGKIPGQMIGVLADLDNGGAVLAYLTNNVDEAEEVYTMSVTKMATALTKISNKLEKKAPIKEISKVPAPLEGIGGNRQSPTTLVGVKDQDTFNRIRNEQIARRQDERKRGLRS